MRVTRHIGRAIGALLLLAVAVAPAFADQSTLGADGVLYSARVGTDASLFPKGHAMGSEATVLALEIQKADGARSRVLVPGGETVTPDTVPFVIWEDSSRRLFLVWEGLSQIHSSVRLVSWNGDA